jgi:hypothetical protein
MPNNTTSKAHEVAELLTKKYYRGVLHPLLLKYKDTVYSILLEEETLESLEKLEDFLLKTQDLADEIVLH